MSKATCSFVSFGQEAEDREGGASRGPQLTACRIIASALPEVTSNFVLLARGAISSFAADLVLYFLVVFSTSVGKATGAIVKFTDVISRGPYC